MTSRFVNHDPYGRSMSGIKKDYLFQLISDLSFKLIWRMIYAYIPN